MTIAASPVYPNPTHILGSLNVDDAELDEDAQYGTYSI